MLIGTGTGIPFRQTKGLGSIIRSLFFSSGEKGVIFDPTDFTTLFKDNAGTQPITSFNPAGDTVGLMLDKSKGLALGSEIVDPIDFHTFTTSGGIVTVTSNTSYTADAVANVYKAVLTVGRWYKITINATFTSSNLILYNGASGSPQIGSTLTSGVSATYYFYTVATQLNIRPGSAGSVTVNSITVKELPGYHATQATSTARPILARHPATGKRNLLTYSEDFSNAAWTKVSCSVSANATAAPDGTLTADQITSSGDGYFYQAASLTIGNTYSFSVYLKTVDASSQTNRLKIYDMVGTPVDETNVNTDITVDGTWTRFSTTFIAGVTGTHNIQIGGNSKFLSGESVYCWGAQIELGSTATTYQKTTTIYDTTEAGVNDLHYLRFDGVDDFMVTPSIDFSATDKMSVFAGFRQLASGSAYVLVELSATAATNNGSFAIFSDIVGNGRPDAMLRGDTGTADIRAGAADLRTAPYSAVISSVMDIAGANVATELAEANFRINGAQFVSPIYGGAASVGAGNFGNYAMYIGMRAGTSFPFNGHLYSLVVRGALSDAAQIASGESFSNSRTYAY